jgi:hypothetical protein
VLSVVAQENAQPPRYAHAAVLEQPAGARGEGQTTGPQFVICVPSMLIAPTAPSVSAELEWEVAKDAGGASASKAMAVGTGMSRRARRKRAACSRETRSLAHVDFIVGTRLYALRVLERQSRAQRNAIGVGRAWKVAACRARVAHGGDHAALPVRAVAGIVTFARARRAGLGTELGAAQVPGR